MKIWMYIVQCPMKNFWLYLHVRHTNTLRFVGQYIKYITLFFVWRKSTDDVYSDGMSRHFDVVELQGHFSNSATKEEAKVCHLSKVIWQNKLTAQNVLNYSTKYARRGRKRGRQKSPCGQVPLILLCFMSGLLRSSHNQGTNIN